MVVVLPAGAQIPAPPKLRQPTVSINLDTSLQNEVGDLVACLTPDSACTSPIISLNLESILPHHLKQQPTPRELGAVKFTLDRGVTEKHHSFINPGPLPRGFMHEAQFHSETHQIPVLDFEEGSSDYTTLYRNLLQFIGQSNVVVTSTKLLQYTQHNLNWLAQKAGIREQVRVLPLETLSLELVSLTTDCVGYNIRIEDELRPQILEHITHIGCKFHATKDVPVCALSTSTRQAVATHSFLQPYFNEHLSKLGAKVDTTNRSRLRDNKSSGPLAPPDAVHRATNPPPPPSSTNPPPLISAEPRDLPSVTNPPPLISAEPRDLPSVPRRPNPRPDHVTSLTALLDENKRLGEEDTLNSSFNSDDSCTSSLFTLPAMFQDFSISPESSPTRQTTQPTAHSAGIPFSCNPGTGSPFSHRQTNTPTAHTSSQPRAVRGIGRGYVKQALLRGAPRKPNKP